MKNGKTLQHPSGDSLRKNSHLTYIERQKHFTWWGAFTIDPKVGSQPENMVKAFKGLSYMAKTVKRGVQRTVWSSRFFCSVRLRNDMVLHYNWFKMTKPRLHHEKAGVQWIWTNPSAGSDLSATWLDTNLPCTEKKPTSFHWVWWRHARPFHRFSANRAFTLAALFRFGIFVHPYWASGANVLRESQVL